MQFATVGLDLAKNVIQLQAVNQHGKAVLKKSLKRSRVLPVFANLTPCLIGIEACSSAPEAAASIEVGIYGNNLYLLNISD
jgi:transposase